MARGSKGNAQALADRAWARALKHEDMQGAEISTRIAQYEMASRMQTSVPEFRRTSPRRSS